MLALRTDVAFPSFSEEPLCLGDLAPLRWLCPRKLAPILLLEIRTIRFVCLEIPLGVLAHNYTAPIGFCTAVPARRPRRPRNTNATRPPNPSHSTLFGGLGLGRFKLEIMLPSFKKPAKGLVILSIATTVGNVVLNHLVAPPDGADRSTSGPRAPFDPTATDVIDYEHLNFLEDGEQMELTMGLSYILQQSAPRWIQALTQRFSPITITVSNTTKSVTTSIYDARKTKDSINFEDSGFTLIDISEDRATIDNVTDWRAQGSENPWQSADPRR